MTTDPRAPRTAGAALAAAARRAQPVADTPAERAAWRGDDPPTARLWPHRDTPHRDDAATEQLPAATAAPSGGDARPAAAAQRAVDEAPRRDDPATEQLPAVTAAPSEDVARAAAPPAAAAPAAAAPRVAAEAPRRDDVPTEQVPAAAAAPSGDGARAAAAAAAAPRGDDAPRSAAAAGGDAPPASAPRARGAGGPRAPISKPGPFPVIAASLGLFLVVVALLAFQLRAGADPAIGKGEPVQVAAAATPAPRKVLIRRVIVTRIVEHRPRRDDGGSAPAPAAPPRSGGSAPAPAASAPAPAPAAPAPAPAPPPVTTRSS